MFFLSHTPIKSPENIDRSWMLYGFKCGYLSMLIENFCQFMFNIILLGVGNRKIESQSVRYKNGSQFEIELTSPEFNGITNNESPLRKLTNAILVVRIHNFSKS